LLAAKAETAHDPAMRMFPAFLCGFLLQDSGQSGFSSAREAGFLLQDSCAYYEEQTFHFCRAFMKSWTVNNKSIAAISRIRKISSVPTSILTKNFIHILLVERPNRT
jgi:hypothetical protein